MKTLLPAALAATALNAMTTADVLAGGKTEKSTPTPIATQPQFVTAHQPTNASLEKALAPDSQASKWSWIPVQRSTAGAPQTRIVAIPIPAPGAAALIGLSGLIFSRRRNGA